MKKLPKQVIAGMLALWLTGCTYYPKGKPSDHYDGKKFYNPGKPMKNGLGEFLKWRFSAE